MTLSGLLSSLINDAHRNHKQEAFNALKLLSGPVAELEAKLAMLIAERNALQLDFSDIKARFCSHHATPGSVSHGCPQCRIAELEARLEAAAGQWRPIAEAPRDGGGLVLFDKDYRHIGFEGFWDGRFWRSSDDDRLVHPTHYQPLPAPPITENAHNKTAKRFGRPSATKIEP